MNFYVFSFFFIFLCQGLRADCECSTAPIKIDPSIKVIASTISKGLYCKESEKFAGKLPDLKSLTSKARSVLFHTTHFTTSIEKQLVEINESLKKNSLGFSDFYHEGNAFAISDNQGVVRLVTAKHVVESGSGEFMYVMRDLQKPLFNLSTYPITANPNLIAIDKGAIVKSKTSDVAILNLTNASIKLDALPIRDFKNNTLKINEPVVLFGYQQNKLRSFNCSYKGSAKENFQRGEIVGYFKCDNKNILLGTISGGVLMDSVGNAVAVFNGTISDKKNPDQKNYIVGTPLFVDETGKLDTSPFLRELEGLCVPCLEFPSDIFSENSTQRENSCLILNTSKQMNRVFQIFD